MSFITREDGEHFVVPSYRDVVSAKNSSLLKKEIISLSQNYGEYITLQKKNATQYEAAFSSETGYLLGETVWHHFNRPADMIYCEAIPNTTSAILVIVKSGSVYLDGSFPLDSIAEELVIFLTQQNHFEIFIYGDVPISKEPAEGKFAFDAASVKSFTVLENPAFPALPLLKIYKLELVKTVLERHGIGVLPTRKIMTALLLIAAIYFGYVFITSEQVQEVQEQVIQITQEDPYKYYYATLAAPQPNLEIKEFLRIYNLMSSIPGWQSGEVQYSKGKVEASVTTKGAQVALLREWARVNNAKVDIESDGISVIKEMKLPPRPSPIGTLPILDTLSTIIDSMQIIYPGNVMQLSSYKTKGLIKSTLLTVDLQGISFLQLSMVGDQLQNLPVKVEDIKLKSNGNTLNVTFILQVVGT